MKLFASEAPFRRDNIEYLYKTLKKPLEAAGGSAEIVADENRCAFSATVPDESPS